MASDHTDYRVAVTVMFTVDVGERMVVALFAAGHTTVILDATNLAEDRRREWKSSNWKTVLHVVPTDKETCIARAQALGQDYLVPVIERMYRGLIIDAFYDGLKDWEFV